MDPQEKQQLEHLLHQAQKGNSEAAQALFDRYAKHFLIVIRQKLAKRLRTAFDSDDFLQDTRLKLFTHNLHEACSSVESFIAFLTGVAKNQVLKANRKHLDCQGRNLKREVSLNELTEFQEISADQSSASELVTAEETWEHLIGNQPPLYRQILLMTRQGFTHREIASALQISEKFIQRWLSKTFAAHFHERS